MLHRFVKPAFFVLLVLGIAFLALHSGRGASLLDSSFHMGRFADYSELSPLLSTCLMASLSLPALICFLVPDEVVTTLLVAASGFWPGFALSTMA
ncbi:MAG: hypothetical protein Q4F72_11580, partial [Desulfovibrionaceae bacterium]|nr:hypothetical protein [Desulfovibrionaceae bacterium]